MTGKSQTWIKSHQNKLKYMPYSWHNAVSFTRVNWQCSKHSFRDLQLLYRIRFEYGAVMTSFIVLHESEEEKFCVRQVSSLQNSWLIFQFAQYVDLPLVTRIPSCELFYHFFYAGWPLARPVTRRDWKVRINSNSPALCLGDIQI